MYTMFHIQNILSKRECKTKRQIQTEPSSSSGLRDHWAAGESNINYFDFCNI